MNLRVFFLLMVFTSLVSATTVNVSIDKYEYLSNEDVMVHLVVDPSEPVGGRLIVYKLAGNKYALARLLYERPTLSNSPSCTGNYALSEYVDKTFLFTPKGDGNYVVEVNFSGIQKTANFSVGSTSTTSTTSVVVSSTSLSSTTSSTSSSTSTSTTSTILEETTTLDSNGIPDPDGVGLSWLVLSSVFLLAAVLIHRR